MKCLVPDTGITISPIGDVVLCCASDNVAVGHIKDIDNITDFFNGDIYNQLRTDFKNKNFPPQCNTCWVHHKAGRTARFYAYNYLFEFPTYDKDISSDVIPIRFLEITTSNICNQMCVMCSGKYSSKWAPYEQSAVDYGLKWRNQNHKFFTKTYKMTDKDVDKILDIVPGLQHLTIKGGEPFADQNNIKILRKVAETNPNCRVEICTNFQLVTKTVIELLHKIKEVYIYASIDGIGSLYNWIRGGNFDKTVNNIKRYHEYAGRYIEIVATISIYNWMDIDKLIDYWIDIPGIHRFGTANMVTFPKYCSPLHLYEHHIKEGQEKLSSYLNSKFTKVDTSNNFGKIAHRSSYINDKLHVFDVNNVMSVKLTEDEWTSNDIIRSRMMEWINFCLVVRQNDEDIFDLVPYLKEYRNEK